MAFKRLAADNSSLSVEALFDDIGSVALPCLLLAALVHRGIENGLALFVAVLAAH